MRWELSHWRHFCCHADDLAPSTPLTIVTTVAIIVHDYHSFLAIGLFNFFQVFRPAMKFFVNEVPFGNLAGTAIACVAFAVNSTVIFSPASDLVDSATTTNTSFPAPSAISHSLSPLQILSPEVGESVISFK